jgi:hypothetical protein
MRKIAETDLRKDIQERNQRGCILIEAVVD